MTVEKSVLVRIPKGAHNQLHDIIARAEAALARARKMPPGDRTETIRFDSLHSGIEKIAIAAMADGEPYEVLSTTASEEVGGVSVFGPDRNNLGVEGKVKRWVDEGYMVIELRLPHFPGPTRLGGEIGVGPPKPAERWVSESKRDRDAIQARFDHLLSLVLQNKGGSDACIRPSGISNTILTEGLRKYTCQQAGRQRIDVPVVYKDGSKGEPFPLHSLRMTEEKPTGWPCYRFTLLSIRHVEMDHKVDGAWLRNVKISRTRAAGLTDAVAFETSRRQFRRLACEGPSLVYLYQTGLEPAILGFYRALTFQLLEQPGSVAVVPYYYLKDGGFSEGSVWATN